MTSAMGSQVADEYLSSLTDLTVNSKPLINMLTMLAEENSDHAPQIVSAIESHIEKVSNDVRLPILYLIDSIVKNVTKTYAPLFTNNIVQIFASVFEKADEKTRLAMYKLRGTWNDVFPPMKMYTLDLRIQHIDQNWPVQSSPPTSIHVNPKFLKPSSAKKDAVAVSPVVPPSVQSSASSESELEATFRKKQEILQQLQLQKRELEQLQQKVLFGDQLPQAIVRPVLNEDMNNMSRNITVPKMAPRAVILPPAPGMVSKTKIAPVKSDLIAAAKSRDPRLAKMTPNSSRKSPERDPRKSRKFVPTPSPKKKVRAPPKAEKNAERSSESEADLLEDLLKKQKKQQANRTSPAPKSAERKPEIVVEEVKIQQRQHAMLKAPVRKAPETEKPRRRRSPLRNKEQTRNPSPPRNLSPLPRRRNPSPPSSPLSSSPKNKDGRRGRDKPSERKRSVVKKVPRERSPLRKPSPKFSPEPEENGQNVPLKTYEQSAPIKSSYGQVAPVTPLEPITPDKPLFGQVAPVRTSVEPMVPVRPSLEPVETKKSSTPNKSPYLSRDVEIIEPSPSPEPPPPPCIGPDTFDVDAMDVDDLKEKPASPVGFKTLKNKSRNYSRRNKTRSPSPIADVDHRSFDDGAALTGQSDQAKEDVDVGKDVDLRVFSRGGSPKKRQSTGDTSDEPPNKRGKPDDVMSLFGNKDMDERRPPTTAAAPSAPPASPPPPPVISTTPPQGSPMETDESPSKSWADVKPKPEAEVKPLPSLSRQLEMRVADIEKAERERSEEQVSPATEQRDRLGRLLLYSRLPVDPRARRESLNHHEVHSARDINAKLHVDDILTQAREQLDRGNMTQHQYNELLAQIVRMNEDQKIRDLQRQRRPMSRPEGPMYDEPMFQDYRRNGPWGPRMHYDEPFARRRRGRGNQRGGRMSGPWAEGRFPPGGHDWRDHDSRSQEPWPAAHEPIQGVVVPPSDPHLVDTISRDPVKHISIDGTPRAIRYYGGTAVVLLSFNSSREISFENGIRRVFIAGLEIPCQLNGPDMPFIVQKGHHSVRLGAPTRELYIDDRFYEVHFGGPPAQAELGGVPCTVQLEGPPPQVRIAPHPNHLCLGSVLLIIDARVSVPVYLDAKPQRFDIANRPLVLKFVNSLRIVLINDVPVPLEFGGAPVPINFLDAQHFLRLTELPPGVVPGKVSILGMDGLGASPPHIHDNNSMEMPPLMEPEPAPSNTGAYMEMVSTMMGQPEDNKEVSFKYEVDAATVPPSPAAVLPAAEPAEAGQKLNITDLFKSLLATGIIAKPSAPVHKVQHRPVLHVKLRDYSSLHKPQPGVVDLLYSGIQCSSCGVRFPPEETAKYSQHLDWHFRQNRRDRDIMKRGSSRRWYYDLSDWVQFEEIEDLEERAQSWFETEGIGGDDGASREAEIKSVAAPPDSSAVCCHVCHDRFETFYHEETEEWHLRNCLITDENYYHPICYEDSLRVGELIALDKPTSLPLLEPLKKVEPTVKHEESVVILDLEDKDDDDVTDVEVVTSDQDAIHSLLVNLVDQVIADEECQKLEDDELEVLPAPKEKEKEPVEVIDVPDLPGDEVYGPPSPSQFDPNKKIKEEPTDDVAMESASAQVDQTIANVTSSIDGNIEMSETSAAPTAGISKIKITFTKPTAVVVDKPKVVDSPIDPSELQEVAVQPDPLPLKPKKPRLANVNLIDQPAVKRGTDESGLCSIM